MLKPLVATALTAGCIGLLFSHVDLQDVVDNARDANLPLLAAAAILRLVILPILSLRWHLLVRHLKSPGPVRLLPSLAVGYLGNFILPLNLGTLLRTYYLRQRHGVESVPALASVAVEGALDVVVLVLLFGPVLFILGAGDLFGWTALVFGGLAVALLIVLRLLPQLHCRALPLVMSTHLGHPLRPAARLLEPPLDALRRGALQARDPKTLLLAILLTILARSVTVGVHWLVGLAFGFDLAWPAYLLVTAAANASGMISFSQGNIGPYEVATSKVLSSLGTESAAAAAYGVIAHAVLALPVMAAGLLFLLHSLVPRLKTGSLLCWPRRVIGTALSGGGADQVGRYGG